MLALASLVVPAASLAAPQPARQPVAPVGVLSQLKGGTGCLSGAPQRGCTRVRALRGPAPFLGSGAVAISPDGTSVYVAASRSNAIAIFRRNPGTGALKQGPGSSGCIAQAGVGGCATADALSGPNSLAVSADGRNLYATSLASDSVDVFRRDPASGALSQLGSGAGCVSDVMIMACTRGRALTGPDVVSVSPDGRSVYVGAFKGNAIAVFTRTTSTGALTQSSGAGGCVTNAPTGGCTLGMALGAPEGIAVSPDGSSVYVAAALSNALDVFARSPSTGALAQAGEPSGCIVDSAVLGCTTGRWLAGADAVAVSPDSASIYATSALSNSLTTFTRSQSTGLLTQQSGTSGCVIYVLAVGCSLARAISDPEGLAVSSDGASIYTTAFVSGAIDVLGRNLETGAVMQKPRSAGCLSTPSTPGCTTARGLLGVSSAALSPDGRFLYAAAYRSNAISIFKRQTNR